MSDERLILALREHYKDIVKAYADRISKGKESATIADVAQSYLLGLSGISSDVDFSIFLTNALKDKKFRFSSNISKTLDDLITHLKKESFGSKHPMIKFLEDKRPIKSNASVTSLISFNTKQQMIHLKEELNKDQQLKAVVAEHALNHALEHDPQHLFSAISSMTLYGELGEKLTILRESCLDKHQTSIL